MAPFGTGIRCRSAGNLSSHPPAFTPERRLAPASRLLAQVAVAGRASRQLAGRKSRKTSVHGADLRAVSRARCQCLKLRLAHRPLVTLAVTAGQCPTAGHASRQTQRLPVGVVGGGPGLCLYPALLRGKDRDAAGCSHLSRIIGRLSYAPRSRDGSLSRHADFRVTGVSGSGVSDSREMGPLRGHSRAPTALDPCPLGLW